MRTNFNFSALNSSGRRSFSLQKKSPKWKKIVALSAALALVLGISSCAIIENVKKDKSDVPPTTPSQSTEETTNTTEEDYKLLIDKIELDGLEMVDNLTPKIEEELKEQLEALVPEGETIIDSSDVYIAPDGSAWVSEAEYLKYIESQKTPATPDTTVEIQTGTGETVQEGYIAPDGTVWVSEADYLKYIEGQKSQDTGTGTVTEDVTVEGDYYLAPDGSVWESEADYLKYIQAEQQTQTDIGTGATVEEDNNNFYKAPDGSYWESEADYLASLTIEESVTETQQVVEETGKGTETVEEYYIAPDGTQWASKEMYEEYIKGQETASGVVETQSVVEETVVEQTTVVNTGSDFYMAPDGELWVSEQAYLESIGVTTSTETGMGEETENVAETVVETTDGVEVIPESEYEEVVEDTQEAEVNNYYVDEYGNYWASYEDYVAYMQYVAQESNGKQR